MHYRRKKTAKVSTNSFYIDEQTLLKIDELCFLYNQSRNAIVEWALRFFIGGNFEHSKNKSFKKKKKIFTKKRIDESFFQTSKSKES